MRSVRKVVKSVKYDEPSGTEVQTMSYDDQPDSNKVAIFRTYQVVWYILYVVETFLVFRFIFRLFAANPASPIVRLIYSFSNFLISPFRGIFPTSVVERGSVVEWTTLVAMAGYAVMAYGVIYLFQLIKPVDEEEVDSAVDSV